MTVVWIAAGGAALASVPFAFWLRKRSTTETMQAAAKQPSMFPVKPAPGDTYASGTALWKFNGTTWDRL